MNANLEIPLRKLQSASNTLTRASDELSRQIAVLESALNDRNLRVCAWVEEPIFCEMEVITDKIEHYAEIHYTHRLGYGKHEEQWGLLVSSDWDATDENPKVAFLRDASLEVRLRAADKFPELLGLQMREVIALGDEALKKAGLSKELAEGVRTNR